MPDLTIRIRDITAPAHTASPMLLVGLEIDSDPTDVPIRGVSLQCQIQFEVVRRQYSADEKDSLSDLFGEPSRWGQTLRNKLWTHANVSVPGFEGSTVVGLPVPCTFDINVASTKYLYALEEGEVPLLFLFSGTIFYDDEEGALRTTHISWNKEASFRLPVQTWRGLMDSLYPNTAFIYLDREVFERLYAFKRRHSLPTWEQAMEKLLSSEDEFARLSPS